MTTKQHRARNPGPSWGYQAMVFWDRLLPNWLALWLLGIGTWVGYVFMAEAKRHSRAYLAQIYGRPPTRREVYQHFRAFMGYLMEKLRAGSSHVHQFRWAPETPLETRELMEHTSDPLLLGTFHVGYSDLLGFYLGNFNRRIGMVRVRVGNSDVEAIAQQKAGAVRLIWLDDPWDQLLAMRDVLEAGDSLALQCDRIEFATRTRAFAFLGARRLFPVTIYALAKLFNVPVYFAYGLPDPRFPGEICVYASRLFRPDGEETADAHFQDVLRDLESRLQKQPEQWFNFCPLNPEAPS